MLNLGKAPYLGSMLSLWLPDFQSQRYRELLTGSNANLGDGVNRLFEGLLGMFHAGKLSIQ